MAHYYDMCHAQFADRIFQRRRRAVLATVSGVGRHKISYVSVDEKFTLISTEYRRHMHSAVAAGNQHGAGMLPLLGQRAIPAFILGVRGRLPAVIALDQIGRQGACVLHYVAFLTEASNDE